MRPISTIFPAFPTQEVRIVWRITEKEEDVFVTEAATVQEAAAAAGYYPFVRACVRVWYVTADTSHVGCILFEPFALNFAV